MGFFDLFALRAPGFVSNELAGATSITEDSCLSGFVSRCTGRAPNIRCGDENECSVLDQQLVSPALAQALRLALATCNRVDGAYV